MQSGFEANRASTDRAGSPPAEAANRDGGRAATVGTICSEDLFRGLTEVRLLHRGEEYRLRITRQGKLILTK